MAKFYGEIGYAPQSVETAPGVWDDVIMERKYYGDVIRNTRQLVGEKVNNDITVGNSISIMADDNAFANFMDMKYIKWAGKLWQISDIEVQAPRLILRLGGLYNGPTPTTPDPA
jgi:hypothetical protein